MGHDHGRVTPSTRRRSFANLVPITRTSTAGIIRGRAGGSSPASSSTRRTSDNGRLIRTGQPTRDRPGGTSPRGRPRLRAPRGGESRRWPAQVDPHSEVASTCARSRKISRVDSIQDDVNLFGRPSRRTDRPATINFSIRSSRASLSSSLSEDRRQKSGLVDRSWRPVGPPERRNGPSPRDARGLVTPTRSVPGQPSNDRPSHGPLTWFRGTSRPRRSASISSVRRIQRREPRPRSASLTSSRPFSEESRGRLRPSAIGCKSSSRPADSFACLLDPGSAGIAMT